MSTNWSAVSEHHEGLTALWKVEAEARDDGVVTVLLPDGLGTIAQVLVGEEFFAFREAINTAYDHIRLNKENATE